MTKMLVPQFRERMGDTRGCTGATMEDGTVYRANRRGQIDVERGDHVRAMLRDPAIAGDIIRETAACRVDFAGRSGRFCSVDCDPTEYQPFTKLCPRCGAPTREAS